MSVISVTVAAAGIAIVIAIFALQGSRRRGKRPAPSVEAAPAGATFFRTLVADETFDGQDLRGAFFGRSEIRDTSFRDADLAGATLCWNDFLRVDFRDADFSGADLRRSTFTRCRFEGARFDGAKLARRDARGLDLSPEQRASIDWRDDGEEPAGG